MPEADRYRLPSTVVPSHYDLELEPDLEAATFAGTVAITVTVSEPTSEIVLNAEDLELDEASLTQRAAADADKTGATLPAEPIAATPTLDPETERVTLTLAQPIEPGEWVVQIRFRGILNDKLVGFYRSTFTDNDGEARTIAVTQFEATHARRAFPCWDEPGFKARFSITLVVPDGLAAIANSPEISSIPAGDGKHRLRFAETMVMSTYLVAWVVGPLEVTDSADAGGVPTRIAHPPGMGDLTGFALESATFALPWFAGYYDIAYPGLKVDLVAVPDFAFGAMENLGCITFREALLLVDPERATQPELQNIADVIHHELAHMWFGDLVTMRWWNGIWLNEAFATFMEMKATDAFRPDWERWVAFGLSRTAAFEVDALRSTRPIEFEVISPEDAEGMFDVLTYEKGAAVLRMLEQFLGEDEFRRGIRSYLAKHAYGNTETTDLWDAIEEATAQPVRHIADSWIFQGGHPVVEPELVGKTMRLRQERFVLDGGDPGDQLWAVPVVVRYGTADRACEDKVLLDHRVEEFDLRCEADWVHLNAGASGFFRARYPGPLLDALGQRLDTLSAIERYTLLDDVFASVLAGTTTAADFLALARRFADDGDLAVWQRLTAALATLDRVLDDADRPRFAATVRALVGPALQRMGWEPDDAEPDRTRQLRATLIEAAGITGDDDEVASHARRLLAAYLDDPESVDTAVASACIAVVADRGRAEEFDQFLERFRKTDNPQEELRFLYALARFRDEPSFERMLELSLSEVRTQNAPFVLGMAMRNRALGTRAWDFVRQHWDEICERFPTSTIVRMAEGVRWLTDPETARDVEAFFAEHPVPQGEQQLAQHLERLHINVAFRERERERLPAALP